MAETLDSVTTPTQWCSDGALSCVHARLVCINSPSEDGGTESESARVELIAGLHQERRLRLKLDGKSLRRHGQSLEEKPRIGQDC